MGDRQDRGATGPVGAAARRPGRARRGPRRRAPAPRPRPRRRGVRRGQGVRDAHRAQGPQGARLVAAHRRRRPPRAAPTPATSSSTSSSCSPTSASSPATSASASASSSTRCRTSPRPSWPRSAARSTRSASARPRSSSSVPACRTCRSRSRRPSRTPSGSSATSPSTGCPATWPCARGSRPAAEEGVEYDDAALDLLYELTDGYPYFVQAYGKVTWDVAVASPIRPDRRERGSTGGRGRAGRRLLRCPLRARHPGRARLHAHDGRPRRGPGVPRRSPPRRWPRRSAASRSR